MTMEFLGFIILIVTVVFVSQWIHTPAINKQQSSDSKIIALCLALSIAIFILDSLIPLGVSGGVPYIFVILVSVWSPRKKLPIYMAIGCSILTIVGFYSSPSGGELWKVLFNRSLALFAIWITAILSVQREKSLLRVKTLSGLLPICASCKKIRDDKGYWNQIEAYIRDYSEADFSHGICPGCAIKIHPDLDLNNVVGGDFKIEGNSITPAGDLPIIENDVDGNLKIVDNTIASGNIDVTDNTVDEVLKCDGNDPNRERR